MNTITNRVSWNEFTEMVGLTPSQTTQALQELTKKGFVKKVNQGYSLTEKGKTALKTVNKVPKDMEFHFYTGIGEYTGLSANSLHKFYELTKKVDSAALEFHILRGDFENWIMKLFNDTRLANEFGRIRKSKYKGETLRNEIIEATENAYYKFKNLFSEP